MITIDLTSFKKKSALIYNILINTSINIKV